MSLLDSYYDDNIVRFYDYKEFLPFCALTCQDYVTMDLKPVLEYKDMTATILTNLRQHCKILSFSLQPFIKLQTSFLLDILACKA